MAQIKSVDRIAEKWGRVTPTRTQDYIDGVDAPRRDWEASTVAASDSWQQGTQRAATEGRFQRGVRARGNAGWQARTRQKGPNRFAEGVQVSQQDYQQAYSPYADVIKNTTLPPRFATGDPRNLQRVTAIATALNRRRTGQTT
jgi:hypothetical protein